MRALLRLLPAACICAFAGLAKAQTQQSLDYLFNYRVGSTLTPDELAYFGLFQHGIPDSVTIGYAADTAKTMVLTPYLKQKATIPIKLRKEASQQFKALIVNYEAYTQDPRTLSLYALQGVDLTLPLIKHETQGLYIEATSKGKAYVGEVVACANGKLALFDANTSYRLEEAKDNLIILNVSDIDTLESRAKALGKYVGAAVGFTAGLSLYAFTPQILNFDDVLSQNTIALLALPATGFILGSIVDAFNRAERVYRPAGVEADRSKAEKYLHQKSMFPGQMPPELARAMQLAR